MEIQDHNVKKRPIKSLFILSRMSEEIKNASTKNRNTLPRIMNTKKQPVHVTHYSTIIKKSAKKHSHKNTNDPLGFLPSISINVTNQKKPSDYIKATILQERIKAMEKAYGKQ